MGTQRDKIRETEVVTMNKKALSILVSVMMVLTCIPASVSAAKNTYNGPWPVLPNAVAKKAIQCSWPYGTNKSKYKYSSGKPTAEYKKALNIAYPDRGKWNKKSKVGASCDVFVGTVVRASGYDSDFPRALEKDLSYLPASTDKWKKTGITKVKDMRPGDVILFLNKNGGGHISVYVEVGDIGYIANAHYLTHGGCYGCIDAKAKDFDKSDYKSFAVYRQKKTYRTAFSRGDYSSEVKKLQNFLNWAGFDCGTADGAFGKNTEKAVIAFQKAAGLEADGEFGSMSLAAAKKYVPSANTSVSHPAKTSTSSVGASVSHPAKVAKPAKVAYTGKYPTKLISKKKGSKKNIKYWQAYLKWYGYSIAVDGDFGKQTLKYTKRFQKKHHLKADGIVGKMTIAKAKKVKRAKKK